MNKLLPRFFPALFAVLTLLGCLLPFVGAGQNSFNLLSAPDLYAQASTLVGGFFGGFMNGGKKPDVDPHLAVVLARFLYVVPLIALAVLILNLRGFVGRTLQLLAGLVWIVFPIAIPWIASQVLLEAMPFLKKLAEGFGGGEQSFSVNLAMGGWLVILCGIGIILHALGLLKINMAPGFAAAPSAEGGANVVAGQVAAEVGEFSSRVAQTIAEHAPEVREKTAQAMHAAGEAASHLGRVAAEHAPAVQEKANKILQSAGSAAVHTGDLLADPRNRRGLYTVLALILGVVFFFYILLPTVRYFNVWMERQVSHEQIQVSALEQARAVQQARDDAMQAAAEERKSREEAKSSSSKTALNEAMALFDSPSPEKKEPPVLVGMVTGYSRNGWPMVGNVEAPLAGIGEFAPGQRDKIKGWIQKQGNMLRCEPATKEAYRCLTPSKVDVAEAALLNGAARVFGEARDGYAEAEAKAKESHRGMWQ